MGCECCKQVDPKSYEKCKIGREIPFKGHYLAPCGTDFMRGSNYTAPKKKKKRKKK